MAPSFMGRHARRGTAPCTPLQRDGTALNTALRIFLRVIQGSLHHLFEGFFVRELSGIPTDLVPADHGLPETARLGRLS